MFEGVMPHVRENRARPSPKLVEIQRKIVCFRITCIHKNERVIQNGLKPIHGSKERRIDTRIWCADSIHFGFCKRESLEESLSYPLMCFRGSAIGLVP